MNITTNLLGELARANRVAGPTAFDSTVEVPGQVLPIISLRGVLNIYLASTVTQNSSFMVQDEQFVTNASGFTTPVSTLGAGIWELNIHLFYTSNYSNSGNGGYRIDLATATLIKVSSLPTAGGMVSVSRKLILELDVSTQLTSTIGTNGVGNSHQGYAQIYAAKLL